MDIPIEVSPLRAYQKCPKLFEYRYVRNLERQHKSRPLLLGLELHKVFEEEGEYGWENALKRVDTRWSDATSEQRGMYTNVSKGDPDNVPTLPDDVRRIIRAHLQQYKNDDWDVLERELLIKGEIDGIPFQGIVDKLVRSDSLGDGITLVDHKSTGRIPDESIQRLDIQLPMYAVAARTILGLDIQRVAFDYILTKPPTVPEIVGLKDKKRDDMTWRDGRGPRLSTRSITTDAWTFMETFREAQTRYPNITMDDTHSKLLRQAQVDTSKFFKRVTIELTPHITDTVLAEAKATRVFAQASINTGVYPRHTSITACPTCDYKRLCMAEFDNYPEDIEAALEEMQPNNYWDRHKEKAA